MFNTGEIVKNENGKKYVILFENTNDYCLLMPLKAIEPAPWIEYVVSYGIKYVNEEEVSWLKSQEFISLKAAIEFHKKICNNPDMEI